MSRITIAWEIGAGRGHVGPMLPIADALCARGHSVQTFSAGPRGTLELPEAGRLEILPAPRWSGPLLAPSGRNMGEVLLNFGFHSPLAFARLVAAWRERLQAADLLISNVAPAAIIAARTLAVPYVEASQGFHVPPAIFPTPPFRDWQPAPRRALEAADRRVLETINAVQSNHGLAPIETFGEIFLDRLALLTYPELEMYPERGTSEYFGIMPAASRKTLEWPQGRPRVLAYLQTNYRHLPNLFAALTRVSAAAIVVCPGLSNASAMRPHRSRIVVTEQLLDFPRMAAQADVVICHASHQTTAEALLKGRPVLLLPTHTEQFLTTRRVVRMGAGLGIESSASDPDLVGALRALTSSPSYQAQAVAFSTRYAAHSRQDALETLVRRCEAVIDNDRRRLDRT